MADAYLNIAEQVLAQARRPMRPREIVFYAYNHDFLPPHLYGARQDKTLHARLSEDIAINPERSRFYRTKSGVFFLESLRQDKDIALESREKFLAPPRRKELKKNRVLLVDIDYKFDLRADGNTIAISRVLDALETGRYTYQPISAARHEPNLTIIHSFVVVHRNSKVLSFRCGKYFPESDPLYGRRTIGVGGAVLPGDNDLLYDSMFGIIGNGINELRYGIGLTNRLAEDARYNGRVVPFLAVCAQENGLKIIHLVLSYECPDDFLPAKSALSVNDLRWLDAINPANDLSDFDTTSRILFEQDFVRDMILMRERA